MPSSAPTPERDSRIIPLRRATGGPARSADGQYAEVWPAGSGPLRALGADPASVARDDRVRHYLKVMLPAIPVIAFVLSFLYSYLLLGLGISEPATLAAAQATVPALSPISPLLPLVGAVVLALALGMLCAIIYWGYLRASSRMP